MAPRSAIRLFACVTENASITTSWDDGHPLDLKLADLLRKHNIPATFYIPIDNMERQSMSPGEIREIAEMFDIGGHTYHHVNLSRVPLEEAENEILAGKKKLEDIIGRELVSFCYPQGAFTSQVKEAVQKAGFKGARTMKLLTRRVKDPFEMGTTVQAANRGVAHFVVQAMASGDVELCRLMFADNLFTAAWDRIVLRTLDFVMKKGGVWHLWGHSWEIDDNSGWGRLEAVLRTIGEFSNGARKVDNSQLLRMYAYSKGGVR